MSRGGNRHKSQKRARSHRYDARQKDGFRESIRPTGMSLGERLHPEIRMKLEDMVKALDSAARAIEHQPLRPWLTSEGKGERKKTLSILPDVRHAVRSKMAELTKTVASPKAHTRTVPSTQRPNVLKPQQLPPKAPKLRPQPERSQLSKPAPVSDGNAGVKVGVEVREPQIWSLSSAYAVRRNVSPTADRDEQEQFQKILLSGLSASGDQTGNPIFPVIGLDFGTSSTKAIVQLYGEANDPAFAVEMPTWARTDDNSYLWQTFLGCAEDGRLTPWLEPGSVPIDNLKTGVIFEPSSKLAGKGPSRPTYLEAMAAYLAYAIRYIRGWMLTRHAEVFMGRELIWSVNVGLPAEKVDSADLVCNYRRAAAAALLLADSGLPITTESCRSTINRDDVRDLAKTDETLLARGISVVPEVAAEVAGWARSTKRQDGLYAMIDIGAATLDICTFRLNRNEVGDNRYNIFTAEVRPFGVEAEGWFVAEGKTPDQFQFQCEWQRNRVVWSTIRSKDSKASCWEESETLPVFVCGGGAANALHRRVIENLGPWLRRTVSNAGANILNVEKPRQLEVRGESATFGRLAVAWGLSYPRLLIGEIVPPSAIDDLTAPAVRDVSASFISKDDV